MQLIIDLPNREDQLRLNRTRWAEILSDRMWADHPYRIETNAYGQIVMTRPAGGSHSTRQGRIIGQLLRLLGDQAQPECPVSTSGGVKAVDVGWYSDERHKQVRGQQAFEIAPEICVEVLSPRNTAAEMKEKRRLYFDAGALECWECGLDGRMTYYLEGDPDTKHAHSKCCPEFPDTIED